MNKKYNKIAVIISVLLETILIFSAAKNILQNNMSKTVLHLLAMVCILLPFVISFIADKKKICIPDSFNLVSVLFFVASLYLGEINEFYIILPWWDLLLHAFFGCYMVIVSLYAIKRVIRREVDVSKNRYTMFSVIFAFSFTITLGTIWEVFEFLGDFIFRSGMIKGGIEDTATDLLVKIVAAFITSTYYYLKTKS